MIILLEKLHLDAIFSNNKQKSTLEIKPLKEDIIDFEEFIKIKKNNF